MLIATNLAQLRYSGDYLKNIDIKFIYAPAGVFQLCEHKPDIVITNNYHEAVSASQNYPAIKFIGRDFDFPNYSFNVPLYLLDELSVITNPKVEVPKFEIGLFNPNYQIIEFINYLRCLGNLKIMGKGFCLEELDKTFHQRLTPGFYKFATYVACVSEEEMLKALFMGKPCITSFSNSFTYQNVLSLNNVVPKSNQIDYAWNFSHTNILSEILRICEYEELSVKLKSVFNIEKNNEATKS